MAKDNSLDVGVLQRQMLQSAAPKLREPKHPHKPRFPDAAVIRRQKFREPRYPGKSQFPDVGKVQKDMLQQQAKSVEN
jgi:hypothetical protein